jgi:hypothetical protein
MMRQLTAYLRRLFGNTPARIDDELMGAIDLSDVPYCYELLSRNSSS